MISDSSLSVATRWGVERMFASELVWSAWTRTPMDGMLRPRFLSSAVTGPLNPVRNPPSWTALERSSDDTRPGSEAIGMMPVSPL